MTRRIVTAREQAEADRVLREATGIRVPSSDPTKKLPAAKPLIDPDPSAISVPESESVDEQYPQLKRQQRPATSPARGARRIAVLRWASSIPDFTTPPQSLTGQGKPMGGSHGAASFSDDSGQPWLVKPYGNGGYKPLLDVAASRLQATSGLATPDTYAIQHPVTGEAASAQRLFPGSSAAFSGTPHSAKMSPEDLLTVQKHHVLDWLLSNHDSHPGQFIRTPDNQVVGIDKGQAFKYYGRDKLAPDFHPNDSYGETEPVYNTLYRNFSNGKGDLHDPRSGPLRDYIEGLQNIPDEHFKELFAPFATQAAQAGKLANWTSNKQPGLAPANMIAPNDPEEFLNSLAARKNNLGSDFSRLHNRALAQRKLHTGATRW